MFSVGIGADVKWVAVSSVLERQNLMTFLSECVRVCVWGSNMPLPDHLSTGGYLIL